MATLGIQARIAYLRSACRTAHLGALNAPLEADRFSFQDALHKLLVQLEAEYSELRYRAGDGGVH